ncbi:MAG: HAD family hydrolase [Planctomycetota bacterium]
MTPDSAATGPHHSDARRFDAVICDLDGCLAPERHDPFDAERLLEVRRHNDLAQERGDRPVVTLCTGRPIGFVEAVCRKIGNTTLPAMAENGVWLWHPDTNAFDRDPEITPGVLDQIAAAKRWVAHAFPGVSIQPGKDCSFSLLPRSPDEIPEMEGRLREEFEANEWLLRVSSTHLWINCDLTFVDKGTAIDRFCAHTGLAKERLAGIGDTAHDERIASRVGFFACPANARDEIKRHADYVSELEEVRGVLDILDRLSG